MTSLLAASNAVAFRCGYSRVVHARDHGNACVTFYVSGPESEFPNVTAVLRDALPAYVSFSVVRADSVADPTAIVTEGEDVTHARLGDGSEPSDDGAEDYSSDRRLELACGWRS